MMMEDSFDKIIAQKIRDSFQESEFSFEEQSWNKFLALSEAGKKGVVQFIVNHTYTKAAAIFIVMLSSLIWLLKSGSGPDQKGLAENIMPGNELIITPKNIDDKETGLPEVIETGPEIGQEENKEYINEFGLENQKTKERAFIPEPPLENKTFEMVGIEKKQMVDLPELSNLRIRNTLLSKKPNLSKPSSEMENKEMPVIVEEDRLMPSSLLELEVSGLMSYGQYENGLAPGITIGVGTSFSLNKQLSFTTGLFLFGQSLQIDDNGVLLTSESIEGEMEQKIYANIFAIDIPLNLRYYFRKQGDTQTYISTGVSSLTYLKEVYFTETRTLKEDIAQESEGTIVTRRYIEQNTSSSSTSPFSGFDVAALLNVSIGFVQDLKGKNDLIIEPYIKYPLTSITDREIKIASGGIKLVVNFAGE